MNQNFNEKLNQAVRFKKEKDFQSALPIFEELAESNPGTAYFWFNYAHFVSLINRHKDARTFVENALSIDPSHRYSRSLYAGILLRNGEIEPALEIVDELMEKQSEIPLIRKLVKESEKLRLLPKLQSYFEKWLIRFGNDTGFLSIAAEYYHKIGNNIQAIHYYEKVVEQDKQNQFAYERLVDLKTTGKTGDERIKQLNMILKLSDQANNVHLLGLLAREYKKVKDWDNAEQTYRKILALEPNNLFERKQLGFLYSKKGDSVLAADILKECLMADPEDHFVRSSLISCWKKMDAKDDALAFLDQMLNRYPEKKNYFGIRNRVSKW